MPGAQGGQGTEPTAAKGKDMLSLVLASASPRREQLLTQLGLAFRVVITDVEEGLRLTGLAPPEQARQAALAKARDVARREPAALVLGSDTVVVADGKVLGKPADAADACRMLRLLQGRSHQVITAVALVQADRQSLDHDVTTVWMRQLLHDQIDRYVQSGEPFGKAGAYAIQGRGAALVERIEGCYYNVMGLPLARLVRLLEAGGVQVL